MSRNLKINKKPVPRLDFNNLENSRELQDFYRQAIYTKGYSFTTQAGSSFDPKIVLGGEARMLWGIAVFVNHDSVNLEDTFSLMINSEQMIEDAIWWAYSPQEPNGNQFKDAQFFKLPRPLSGSDSVKMPWTSSTAHKVYVIFYLSNSAK